MKDSLYYKLKLPEMEDPADVRDLTDNFEAVDTELKRQKDEDERQAAEAAAIRAALAAHKAAATLDHPDGSVTDAKLGSRSIGGLTGALQALLTAIGNAIQAATGAEAWNGKPATTLKDAKAHMDSRANPHGVTAAQAGAYTKAETDARDKAVADKAAADSKTVSDALAAHGARKDNPHGVTKTQVGLGNADNTADADKPVSTAQAAAIQSVQDALAAHGARKDNPHGVTKAQVGLGNVPDRATNDQTPTYTAATALTALASGEKLSLAFGKLAKAVGDLIAHLANRANPHGVTKAQVGLSNADNTADANKPVSAAQAAAIQVVQDAAATHAARKDNPHGVTAAQAGAYTKAETDARDKAVADKAAADGKTVSDALTAHKADRTNPHGVTKAQVGLGNVTDDAQVKRAEMGAPGGVATLGPDGSVPAAQLPSYVDDVLEFAGLAKFPAAGESGKIYVAQDTNLTYRWSGTAYVEISKSLALGETDSTAYPGSKGKAVAEGLASTKTEAAANTAARHSHGNKALLDAYTQTEADLAAAVGSKHSHGNKTLLDGLTTALVAAWDGAASHVSDAVKHVTAAERTAWNAAKDAAGAALPASAYTAADVLAKLKTVDGAASGLDADLLDGREAAAFAPAAHTHAKSQITDMPTALKNPAALTISLNGASQGAYDGAAAKSVDVTPAAIGAATAAQGAKADAALPRAGGVMTGALTLSGAPTAALHAATKKYVDDLAAASGTGDMRKSVYDADGDGTVDNAARVNGHTVAADVPAGAKFTDTTYAAMTGATTAAAGKAGLAPAPAAGAADRYLRSDGTWSVPPDTNTTYAAATQSANGLMAAADKKKLDGVAAGANNYAHPAYAAKAAGLYKVTVDATGHVSAAAAVAKADITALGIPAQDTVYALPAASATVRGGVRAGAGLAMSGDIISVGDVDFGSF